MARASVGLASGPALKTDDCRMRHERRSCAESRGTETRIEPNRSSKKAASLWARAGSRRRRHYDGARGALASQGRQHHARSARRARRGRRARHVPTRHPREEQGHETGRPPGSRAGAVITLFGAPRAPPGAGGNVGLQRVRVRHGRRHDGLRAPHRELDPRARRALLAEPRHHVWKSSTRPRGASCSKGPAQQNGDLLLHTRSARLASVGPDGEGRSAAPSSAGARRRGRRASG